MVTFVLHFGSFTFTVLHNTNISHLRACVCVCVCESVRIRWALGAQMRRNRQNTCIQTPTQSFESEREKKRRIANIQIQIEFEIFSRMVSSLLSSPIGIIIIGVLWHILFIEFTCRRRYHSYPFHRIAKTNRRSHYQSEALVNNTISAYILNTRNIWISKTREITERTHTRADCVLKFC